MGLAIGAMANPAARYVSISPSDCGRVENLIAEDAPAPPNTTFMRVQHIGDPGTAELAGEIANPVTWDVAALTGFHASPQAQRGYRDLGPPIAASAFQLDCDGAGFLINTWEFSHKSPLAGEGPSASVGRDLKPPPRPFERGRAMIIDARITIPWVQVQSPPIAEGTAQVGFLYYASDAARGTVFAHVIGLFDNRPRGIAGGEFVSSDGMTAFVGSPLSVVDSNGNTVQYVTVGPSSSPMQFEQGFTGERFFRAIVTFENFRSLLARLEAGPLPGISVRPEDYEIIFFGVLGEVFPGTGEDHNVALGASVRALALHQDPKRAFGRNVDRR
jgi:hypothetical protein